MKFKAIAAAIVAVASVGAQANTQDWDIHGAVEVGLSLPTGMGFVDYFTFKIAPDTQTVSSTAVANNLGNGVIFNVTNGQYSLWISGADNLPGTGDDTQISTLWSFGGQSGDVTNSVLLNPGSYFYKVTGDATGAFGGMYSLTSTTQPVPEPETWVMMIAGLGAVGFLARRRKA